MGKTKIEFALRQKKCPEIVEKPFRFYRRAVERFATRFTASKMEDNKRKTDYERRNKLIRFGLSRGFDMNNILNT